jgi:hypothetical protein
MNLLFRIYLFWTDLVQWQTVFWASLKLPYVWATICLLYNFVFFRFTDSDYPTSYISFPNIRALKPTNIPTYKSTSLTFIRTADLID